MGPLTVHREALNLRARWATARVFEKMISQYYSHRYYYYYGPLSVRRDGQVMGGLSALIS